MNKLLIILLALHSFAHGMEDIEYQRLPLVQQSVMTSMKAGDVDPEIKSKIQEFNLLRGNGEETAIEMEDMQEPRPIIAQARPAQFNTRDFLEGYIGGGLTGLFLGALITFLGMTYFPIG